MIYNRIYGFNHIFYLSFRLYIINVICKRYPAPPYLRVRRKDNNMNEHITSNGAHYEYDEVGNLIHYKNNDGTEFWKEYDKNGNEIFYEHSDGFKCWRDYDDNGREISYRDSNGFNYKSIYDENGKLLNYEEYSDSGLYIG